MTKSQIKSINKIKEDYHHALSIDTIERNGLIFVSILQITMSTIFIIGKRGKIEEVQKEV